MSDHTMSEADFLAKFGHAFVGLEAASVAGTPKIAAPSGALALATCSKDRAPDVRKRDYPRNRATSREKAELQEQKTITLVASGLPVVRIARKLKRNVNYTYRLLERVGCKSVLLTPNEQRALERDRAHRRKKKKARSRRSNI